MFEFLGEVVLVGFLITILGAPILHTILIKKAKDKYREGIQTNLNTVEELMDLLRRLQCSFVKEIYYDESGNVALKTKWGKHTLILQNGLINTNPEEFDTVYSEDKKIVERNSLFQYILKELNHGLPVNAYKYYNTGSRLVRLYTWTPRIFWTFAFIGMAVAVVNIFGDTAVSGVKNGHPQLYPDITYGEAFDFYFNSGEWSSFVSDTDKTVVEYEGKVGDKDNESTILFQFVLSEDGESFSVEYIEVDGIGMADWVASLCILAIFDDYEKGIKGDSSEAVEEFKDYSDDTSSQGSTVEDEITQLALAETVENVEALDNGSNAVESETQVQEVEESTEMATEPVEQQEAAADYSFWETTYHRSRGPYCTMFINEITDTGVNFTIGCGSSGYLAYCDLREYVATITSENTAVYAEEQYGWSLTLIFQDNGTIIIEETGEFYSGVSVGGIYVQEKDWAENSYEYVFANSDSQYLTGNDFIGLTKEDCRIARNEIYARHGRTFSDEVLQAYFETCSWYYGWIAPEEFDDNVLNDVERYNLELIQSYEANR